MSEPGPGGPLEAPRADSPYHRLNPLTKAVSATVTGIAALVLGGVIGPALLTLVAVIIPAAIAGVLRVLVRTTLLLSLPIGISAVLVNVFFFPAGRDVLLRVGPITATGEGLSLGLEVLARILAISGAITLFYLTTRPSDFVADLEHRGVSSRLAFVANASAQTVPQMLERAGSIVAAQRARGLDTEGSIVRRLRALPPLVGPVILGTLGEVEERTMALEARGFSRPGRRTLLRIPADSGVQRLTRWLLVGGLSVLAASRILGVPG
ncbi:MAG: energy-coupling factor transporter transmembrane component T family protein [Candidatus Limnocylindrales bacterium]